MNTRAIRVKDNIKHTKINIHFETFKNSIENSFFRIFPIYFDCIL